MKIFAKLSYEFGTMRTVRDINQAEFHFSVRIQIFQINRATWVFLILISFKKKKKKCILIKI